MDLRDKFKAAVLSAVERCYDIGYSPNILKQMIEREHPVEVAKKLVVSGDLQYGIRELGKLGHLELSIENIMLEDEFEYLFTPQERDAARFRLDDVQRVNA